MGSELFAGIWVGIGTLAWLALIFFDDNEDGVVRSTFFGAFVISLWPIAVLVGLFYLLKGDDEHRTSIRSSNSTPKKPLIAPDVELSDLATALSGTFTENSSVTPSKSDYAKLHRLCTLIKEGWSQHYDSPSSLETILEAGLTGIDDVYQKSEPIKARREKAIREALGKLAPSSNSAPRERAILGSLLDPQFGIPIDVEALNAQFFQGMVNKEYPGDTGTLITLSNGDELRLTIHASDGYKDYKYQREQLDELADDFAEATHAPLEVHTVNGLEYALLSVEENGRVITALSIEGRYFTRAWITYTSDTSAADLLRRVAEGFPWRTPDLFEVKSFKKASEIKKALRAFSRRHGGGCFDEILEGIDENEVFLSASDIEACVAKDVESTPVMMGIIQYCLVNKDDFYGSWDDILPLLKPGGLNAPALYQAVREQVDRNASSINEFLVLLENEKDAAARKVLISRAEKACTDIYDLERLTKSPYVTTEEQWASLKKIAENHRGDEDFYSIGSIIDLYKAAMEKGFEPFASLLKTAEAALEGAHSAEQLYSILQDLNFLDPEAEDDKKTLKSLIASHLPALVESPAEPDTIESIYSFLNEELEEKAMAAAYRARHETTLKALEEEEAERDRERDRLDHMCKCAALVAIGDGHFSEEEGEEIGKVSPFIRLFLRHEEAITYLQKSGNIKAAREMVGEIILEHDFSLFGPGRFASEVMEDLGEGAGMEDILALITTYAAKITSPFERRVALWAAHEIAAADGLEPGEALLLEALASAMDLEVKENQQFFNRYAFPAINDSVPFGDSDENLESLARKLDEAAEEDEGVATLMEALGVSSFEELTSLFKDEKEDARVADSEPAEWITLLSEEGWEGVEEAVKKGLDVTEVMNLRGIENLSLMMVAAEQAPAEVLEAIIQAGGDVNARQGNLALPSGYETPLVAALKGDRMDNFDILLQAGAKVEPFEAGEAGNTPLTIAAQHCNSEAIRTLLKLGADPNLTRQEGWSPLKSIEWQEGRAAIRCARLLLQAGADPALVDEEGYTALHNAVSRGELDAVKLLIEEGGLSPNLRLQGLRSSIRYSTPLDIALSEGKEDIAEYLLAKGAELNPDLGKAALLNINTHNALSAAFHAALDGDLDSPLPWLERAFEAGVTLSLTTLKYMVMLIGNSGSDRLMKSWAEPCFQLLADKLVASEDEIAELSEDADWEETLLEAYDNAPKATKKLVALLKAKGTDLGEDLLE